MSLRVGCTLLLWQRESMDRDNMDYNMDCSNSIDISRDSNSMGNFSDRKSFDTTRDSESFHPSRK